MFRNKELFVQRGMIMHQSDIERFAFLFLCGKRDREILLGKRKNDIFRFGQADVCYRFPWSDKIEPGYLASLWRTIPRTFSKTGTVI